MEYKHQCIFTYSNGRRAINKEFDFTEKQAREMASFLSIDKKRVIVVKVRRFIYKGPSISNPMDMPNSTIYEPIMKYNAGKLTWRDDCLW